MFRLFRLVVGAFVGATQREFWKMDTRPTVNSRECDSSKYSALIAYIGYRTKEIESFGFVLMNKVLVDCELTYFAITNQQMTGQSIQRNTNGPISNKLLPQLEIMKAEKVLEVVYSEYYGYSQKKVDVFEAPDMSDFSELELDIIDNRIQFWSKMDGAQASKVSHDIFGAWNFLNNGDQIPYETAILSCYPLSQEAKDYAMELV